MAVLAELEGFVERTSDETGVAAVQEAAVGGIWRGVGGSEGLSVAAARRNAEGDCTNDDHATPTR